MLVSCFQSLAFGSAQVGVVCPTASMSFGVMYREYGLFCLRFTLSTRDCCLFKLVNPFHTGRNYIFVFILLCMESAEACGSRSGFAAKGGFNLLSLFCFTAVASRCARILCVNYGCENLAFQASLSPCEAECGRRRTFTAMMYAAA